MVICNADSKEVLECWDFKLQLEKTDIPEGCVKLSLGGLNSLKFNVIYFFRETEIVGHKDLKVIQTEIRDVIRQITGCVTFLPMLDCPCK